MSKRTFAITGGAVLLLAAIIGVAANYERIAIATARRKLGAISRSASAIAADTVFWRTLHSGAYEQLPSAIEAVTRAYVETPRDAVTASHVAWLHIWRASEASRLDSAAATILSSTPTSARHARGSRR